MADIISVLANIYDTNDRFIEEFQTNLADRLLQVTDFGIEREVLVIFNMWSPMHCLL